MPPATTPVTNSNSKRKRTHASNAVLYAVFAVGAIVAINLIATRVFHRFDLTDQQKYSVSKPSKDLVKKLPDYLTIKAYISSEGELPPELRSLSRYVRDLVDEYKASSNGRLKWEAVDPAKDKKLEEEAANCNVRPLQVQAFRSQKLEFGSYYLGLCLQYGDKKESIPQVTSENGIEYELTSLIKKMTQKKRKLAFTTGHGESDMNQGFQALKPALEKEYEVTSVNPSSAEIGPDVDALVVAGPKQAIDDKGQHEIDKFFMSGRGGVLLVDGMAMTSPQGGMGMENAIKMGQPNKTGLETMLGAYGFKVGEDFVLDAANVPGPVNVGGRTMIANLPVYVAATANDAPNTKDLTVLAGLRAVVFPFPSSVELVGALKGGKGPAGTQVWALATSSEESWKQTGFFVFNPTTTKLEPTKDKGPFTLGYAFQGTLKSAFPPPADTAGMSTPENKDKPKGESSKPIRLVVVGDSDFANDEYVSLAGRHPLLSGYETGAVMLLNAIAWTAEDETLTALRTKTVAPRPIQVSSDSKVRALQWGNVLGLPIAFCAFGVMRWRVRRARRREQTL